jgi:hypothetical protein
LPPPGHKYIDELATTTSFYLLSQNGKPFQGPRKSSNDTLEKIHSLVNTFTPRILFIMQVLNLSNLFKRDVDILEDLLIMIGIKSFLMFLEAGENVITDVDEGGRQK